jgi:hypothetical protein
MITKNHIDLVAFILKKSIHDLDENMKTDIVKADPTLQMHYHDQRELLKEYYMSLRKFNQCTCAMKFKGRERFSFKSFRGKIKHIFS